MAFVFKSSVRAATTEVHRILEWSDIHPTPVSESVVSSSFIDIKNVLKIGGGFHDLMCSVCQGEALCMLCHVEHLDGFRAWQLLKRHFVPRTLPRAISLMAQVSKSGFLFLQRVMRLFQQKRPVQILYLTMK